MLRKPKIILGIVIIGEIGDLIFFNLFFLNNENQKQ